MSIDRILPNTTPPKRIFITGVPGSRWSGISQELEEAVDADCSDRTPERTYSHSEFSGHVGAYYGTGMEVHAGLSETTLAKPYIGETDKPRVHKSHEWVYMLDTITCIYPKDWVVLVYRDNESSFKWWKEAGGWDISYPNYDWYRDDSTMQERIQEQNRLILDFASEYELAWHQHEKFSDVYVTAWHKNES